MGWLRGYGATAATVAPPSDQAGTGVLSITPVGWCAARLSGS
ncbi:hypothetical protein UO65_3306 [Actinokineospora spheciospongiae]|uniref:Uncharacterized protein n=1 Tax=Actinokineospora spheciospongiae TaxID=909613 RepID=W7IY10_9PSEU|nr:hypothetical protein UO65_3306 [Actinokineospora spheciospongiae]